MPRGYRPVLLVVIVLLAALTSALAPGGRPVVAAGTLDASFEPPSPDTAVGASDASVAVGETFVAGRSGRLDRAGFYVEGQPGAITVQFELYATTAGLPSGAALASEPTTIPAGVGRVWHETAFTTPATVLAGTRYALMLRWQAGSTGTALVAQMGNPYPGGQVVAYHTSGTASPLPTVDAGFRTYVETPLLPVYNLGGYAAPNPIPINQILVYHFFVENVGSGTGANTVLKVDLPVIVLIAGAPTVTPVGDSSPPRDLELTPSCKIITFYQVGCTLGDLPSFSGYEVLIPVRIQSTTLGAQLCARGVASGGQVGFTASAATAQICARAAAPAYGDLQPSLSCPGSAASGVNLTTACTLTVTNTGGYPVTVRSGQELARIMIASACTSAVIGTPTGPAPYGPTVTPPAGGGCGSAMVQWIATSADSIPVGGSRVFQGSIFTAFNGIGAHTANAFVDWNNVIPESNEGNNAAGPALTTVGSP